MDDDKRTDSYYFIVVYASLMILIMPVGIPAVLFALMWAKRGAIEQRDSRRGGPDLKYLSFLVRLVGWGKVAIYYPIDIIANDLADLIPSSKTVRQRSLVFFDHRLLPSHHPLGPCPGAAERRDNLYVSV